MRKMTSNNDDNYVDHDWKGDLIAVFLAALVIIPFVAEWFYWTHAKHGP